MGGGVTLVRTIISLTNMVMRVFERPINRRLVYYMEATKLYECSQHCFIVRSCRSYLLALLSTFENMLTHISGYPSSQIDMIYFDFIKWRLIRFDKVLLYTVKYIGISDKL